MKLKIKNTKGTVKRDIELPKQFTVPVRADIIKKAVLTIQSHKRQNYGASPGAGKRASAYLSKRRNSYRSTYGIGQSRTPRKVMSRRGTRLNYVGAFAPQTVGGRRAHPPKAEKNLSIKINKNERRKAICSAMAATFDKKYLEEKNYIVPEDYPFILDNEFEAISKTKDVKAALTNLKIQLETDRKIRAGKGKSRGRKYIKKKGPLIITSQKCKISDSAKNLNINVVEIENLNTELLAPGAQPGRVALFTEGAIEKLKQEELFLGTVKKKQEKKKEKTSKIKEKKEKPQPKTEKKEVSKSKPVKKSTK